jgi:uncharacterized protein (TIGR03089 family)
VPTFPAALAARLKSAAAAPLVTHYDHASGSRVELSGTTFANWVAKTSSLLVDELGRERGDRIHVDLPVHWLEPVLLGAAWNCGLIVTLDASGADVVVCGPRSLAEHSARSALVLATALHPLGLRFTDPLPVGVIDLGADVFGQPDSFVPWDPPQEGDPAWDSRTANLDQASLLAAATASGYTGRLITDVRATYRPELFLGPLLGGGGTVWVSSPDEDRWEATATAEAATVSVRV